MTRYPAPLSLRAMPSPSPRLAPVTITLSTVTRHFTCGSHGQYGDKVYRRGNLMTRKRVPAKLHNLMPKLISPPGRGARCFIENNIGDDKGTGYRVLSRSNEGHPHPRMPVDHGFYFLRMNF